MSYILCIMQQKIIAKINYIGINVSILHDVNHDFTFLYLAIYDY